MGASATISRFRDSLSDAPKPVEAPQAEGRTKAVFPCEANLLPPELTPRARELLEILNRLFDQNSPAAAEQPGC